MAQTSSEYVRTVLNQAHQSLALGDASRALELVLAAVNLVGGDYPALRQAQRLGSHAAAISAGSMDVNQLASLLAQVSLQAQQAAAVQPAVAHIASSRSSGTSMGHSPQQPWLPSAPGPSSAQRFGNGCATPEGAAAAPGSSGGGSSGGGSSRPQQQQQQGSNSHCADEEDEGAAEEAVAAGEVWRLAAAHHRQQMQGQQQGGQQGQQDLMAVDIAGPSGCSGGGGGAAHAGAAHPRSQAHPGDPILNESGRGLFTECALEDGSSFECPRCGGVVLITRAAQHAEFWCQP